MNKHFKMWGPTVMTAVGTASVMYAEPIHQFVVTFAKHNPDVTLGLFGLYALIKGLLPNPAQVKQVAEAAQAPSTPVAPTVQ